jgi:aerobic-type carbon monoxide dehydrogenase small subunit (CoxS/CutS family)
MQFVTLLFGFWHSSLIKCCFDANGWSLNCGLELPGQLAPEQAAYVDEHLHQCSVCVSAKIFLTSKFSHFLFSQP